MLLIFDHFNEVFAASVAGDLIIFGFYDLVEGSLAGVTEELL
jgi:hypothetical protein